ncbi:hypothetical protein AB4059_13105 [Lysobacter sp. 2RAF19]
MRAWRWVAVLSVAGLAACSGNGYITVRGALIVPPPGDSQCRLSLPQFKGTPDEGDYTRSLKGAHFQESFPVDKKVRDYELVIACAGYQPMTRQVHLDQGVFAVDLGNVVLTRE